MSLCTSDVTTCSQQETESCSAATCYCLRTYRACIPRSNARSAGPAKCVVQLSPQQVPLPVRQPASVAERWGIYQHMRVTAGYVWVFQHTFVSISSARLGNAAQLEIASLEQELSDAVNLRTGNHTMYEVLVCDILKAALNAVCVFASFLPLQSTD